LTFAPMARADLYTYWCTNTTVIDGRHFASGNADPDGSYPWPARWWHTQPWSTNSTGYYLCDNLGSAFKSAVRTAELDWEAQWGGGTQYFHFYEESTAAGQYIRTIGMSPLDDGVLGQVWLTVEPTYHPLVYVGAPFNQMGHTITNWFMRFQSNMSSTGMAWGTGNYDGIADRESIAVHELGHVLGFRGDTTINVDTVEWQSMLHLSQLVDYGLSGKTGSWMRSPARYDRWGMQRLYPGY